MGLTSNMKNVSINKQSGAVSLFVVIFFMLLATVVTVSFIRLMVNDQQQASNNDLSQSALDSAQAGVEDAKRALLRYQQDCSNNPANCGTYGAALTTNECNGALNGISGNGATGSNGKTAEIKVQQSVSGTDATLDQAYTCVTIKLQTEDYVGSIAANQSQLVPLISADPFDRVQIEWFSQEDLSTSGAGTAVDLPSVAEGRPLYSQTNWPVTRPSLMRAQLIQFAGSFDLNSFDTVANSQANAATMFLYPTAVRNIGERDFLAIDQRRTDPGDEAERKDALTTPTGISCESTLGSGGYACKAGLILPAPLGGSVTDRTSFLRLTPFYNATHFKVTLWDGSIDPATRPPIKFKDVQPEIDSTGRANDLFRRIKSRVDLYDTSFPYPEGTIDVTGNFCKDFSVTDTQYIPGSCTP